MVETNYEFNDSGQELATPLFLRLQEYRAQLSGAAGQLYGNGYLWHFDPQWRSFFVTPGSTQFGYLINLFSPRRWFDLVPDQTHALVIAGYGTFTDTGTNLASDRRPWTLHRRRLCWRHRPSRKWAADRRQSIWQSQSGGVRWIPL